MNRTPVQSSQLASVGYDPDQKLLEIQFHPNKTTPDTPGSIYHYYDVPAETHAALLAAPSVGSYFINQIKRGPFRYEKQPVEKRKAGAP